MMQLVVYAVLCPLLHGACGIQRQGGYKQGSILLSFQQLLKPNKIVSCPPYNLALHLCLEDWISHAGCVEGEACT